MGFMDAASSVLGRRFMESGMEPFGGLSVFEAFIFFNYSQNHKIFKSSSPPEVKKFPSF